MSWEEVGEASQKFKIMTLEFNNEKWVRFIRLMGEVILRSRNEYERKH